MKRERYQPSAVSRQQAGAFLFLLLVACVLPAAAQNSAPAAPPARAAYREVTDDAGRRVRVPAEIRRIVSLAPNMTETVYALGLQERLVGVTTFCDHPAEAATKAKIGGPMNPSLERIAALQPDLVLVAKTANRRDTLDALERLGIPAYATSPATVEEMLDSTLRVADLLGARAQGEALVGGLRARLAALKTRLSNRSPKRVLFVVWHEPLVAVGRGTFLADALRWAGAALAIETDQEWPRLSLEGVVRVQPEFLVFATSHSEGVRRTLDDLRARPGWQNLDAVRQGRAAIISDAVNRPGPRLVDAIEELARQLHPEAFEAESENRKAKNEKR
jgi:iron complex transport system substrate-binding protein